VGESGKKMRVEKSRHAGLAVHFFTTIFHQLLLSDPVSRR
jgi:hypothetical protein